jgi:MinD-like ATPase involved in chromosome partitioning or flagellar assembly
VEDEYADRVYVPGTSPAPPPTRDVEPFWPPEELAAPVHGGKPVPVEHGPAVLLPTPPPTAPFPGPQPFVPPVPPPPPPVEHDLYRPADRVPPTTPHQPAPSSTGPVPVPPRRSTVQPPPDPPVHAAIEGPTQAWPNIKPRNIASTTAGVNGRSESSPQTSGAHLAGVHPADSPAAESLATDSPVQDSPAADTPWSMPPQPRPAPAPQPVSPQPVIGEPVTRQPVPPQPVVQRPVTPPITQDGPADQGRPSWAQSGLNGVYTPPQQRTGPPGPGPAVQPGVDPLVDERAGYYPTVTPRAVPPHQQVGPFPPSIDPRAAQAQPPPHLRAPHLQADQRPLHDPYQQTPWTSDGTAPTAEEFARRRLARPADSVATMGPRALLQKSTLGLVKLAPGRREQEYKQDVEMVRRNFGGLRQVTVVNPKGGAGKTVAVLLLAMTFGQKRGGYVLAWDNNETQGTLGMRAQQDFHARTVRDMMRDLDLFRGSQGRVGDLSQYVRAQGEGMFDVLASDESATAGEMLTASAFGEIREIVSRFYKLIFVDTGNNVRAQNWQAAMDATDQLVITMSARNDSAETAARMLDHLEQSGRQRLVRQAISVVSMPPTRKDIDLPAIERHFAARTRAVLISPYEKLIDSGEPLRYAQLSADTRNAWLKIAAAVAEGL